VRGKNESPTLGLLERPREANGSTKRCPRRCHRGSEERQLRVYVKKRKKRETHTPSFLDRKISQKKGRLGGGGARKRINIRSGIVDASTPCRELQMDQLPIALRKIVGSA